MPCTDIYFLIDTIVDKGNLNVGRLVFDLTDAVLPERLKGENGLFKADTFVRSGEEVKALRGGFKPFKVEDALDGRHLQFLGIEVNYPSEKFVHRLSMTTPYLQSLIVRNEAKSSDEIMAFLRETMKSLVGHISRYLAVIDAEKREQTESNNMWERDQELQLMTIWLQRAHKPKLEKAAAAQKEHADTLAKKKAKSKGKGNASST